jgi:mRNA interferase RelE/StbE
VRRVRTRNERLALNGAGLVQHNLVTPSGEARLIEGSSFDARPNSGYNMARMLFTIVLAPEAVKDLKRLPANVRAIVRRALETHLRHEPEKTTRSRIKRLRGLLRPQFQLRVGEVRVFYDVSSTTVEILAIVAKSEAESWLAQFASPE